MVEAVLSQVGGQIDRLPGRQFAEFVTSLPPYVEQRLDNLQAQFVLLLGNGGGMEVRAAILEPLSVQMAGSEEMIVGQKRPARGGQEEVFVQCCTRIESLGPSVLTPVYQITVDKSGHFDLRAPSLGLFLQGGDLLFNRLLSAVKNWPIRPYYQVTPTISLEMADSFYQKANCGFPPANF
jgi:hypothetical protein